MASRLTDKAKTLQHLCKRANQGLPADVVEPEGPFQNEEEQEAYDLLRTLTDVQEGPVVIITYSATLQTYTTTADDLIAKCGAGTTASAVTRTSAAGTSTISQAAANFKALAAAKTAALAAIVCPVVSTPTTTPVTLANHADSGGIEHINTNGVKVRAAGASITRKSSGAYAEILVKASAGYANANFTVLVDGAFSATNYIPTGEAGGKTYRTALPNDGMSHTVRYILGDELRAEEQGDGSASARRPLCQCPKCGSRYTTFW
jgi:hypothetical protein